ncbi:hypothetical protein GCM10023156_30400 [Novipirellula rosea]|uniref:Nucleoside 2-deoxyribosyltransferase n=2 Tax=Novipirellula rosea TaxID=1031540 RepID=A0ABP8MW61_9BACT
MINIWVISPFSHEYPEEWERVLQFNLQYGIASLGFRKLGDCSELDVDTIIKRHYDAYPDWEGRESGDAHQVARFYSEIQLDDVVLARRGTKVLAAIGTVNRMPYYDDQLTVSVFPDDIAYPNHIGVDWRDEPRNLDFGRQIFGYLPFCSMDRDRFDAIADEFGFAEAVVWPD